MDKDFMLRSIRARIEELKHEYALLCLNDGRFKNRNSQTVRRSYVRKDLDICLLVQTLIECCPDNIEVVNEAALNAFKRLTEQQR